MQVAKQSRGKLIRADNVAAFMVQLLMRATIPCQHY
jgi:hypothetical protein